ncbi:hypothetical protein, partial [Robertkochia solimangrovi]|uniref:hypothetical protein n=1 Tax=Robertkochia solimangrovi TaxID=2213046 RepID=UPI001A7E3796
KKKKNGDARADLTFLFAVVIVFRITEVIFIKACIAVFKICNPIRICFTRGVPFYSFPSCFD